MHDAGVPFVWTIAAGADGAWFLGTGNDGKVIQVDRNGQGSVFYDSSRDGSARAGAGPERRALRRHLARRPHLPRRREGQATTFFDPDDKYIWSLAVDREGSVFAATGDKGIVYRITPDGKGAEVLRVEDDARRSRSRSISDRQLLVGTGAPGRVFRVDSAGKGFLLLDTTYQEIHSIRVDPKGVIYVAAQSGRAQGGGDSLHRGAGRRRRRSRSRFRTCPPRSRRFAVIDVPVIAVARRRRPPSGAAA